MLLIEGPAGIGKTRLLAAATELGRPRTVLVLEARAGQLEREMPFVVARQLLEPMIERADGAERSRLLAGSAALSLIAFGLAGSGGPDAEVDPFAPIHGLYWLLANLCDSQPVLIVIDDAQWADTQSLRWLDFLARRVPTPRCSILVGARTGEADEPAELEPLRLDATEVLRPSPLSGAAVERADRGRARQLALGGVLGGLRQGDRRQPVPADRGAAHAADEVDRPGCGGGRGARVAGHGARRPLGPLAAGALRCGGRLAGARDRGARRGSAAAPCVEDGRGQRGSRPGALRSASRRRDPGARASDRLRSSAGPNGGLSASCPRRVAPTPIAGPRS